jgi:hypothetical protein
MPNPALVSADFIIGGKPERDEEEEEEKEEDENRDAIVVVVVRAPPPPPPPPPRAGDDDDDDDDERPLRDFPEPKFLLRRVIARFQNSPTPRRLPPPPPPPPALRPPELNASAPNFPSTNRIIAFFFNRAKAVLCACFNVWYAGKKKRGCKKTRERERKRA